MKPFLEICEADLTPYERIWARQNAEVQALLQSGQEREKFVQERSRKPKNFTIAQENGEWLDQMAAELTLRTRKKVSTSALVNAILDRARREDEKCERLEFIK